MWQLALLLAVGLVAGIVSGLVGIGGGVIIIPALVFLVGLSQRQAQGTTLALLVPPIGLLAVWTYYQKGDVDIRIAVIVAAGFVVGGLIGAKVAVGLSNAVLAKMFGVLLLGLGLQMILR